MNTEHLQQIINNYLARFEELNNPHNMEYYKWQIAYQFKTLMDEAISTPGEEFPMKLYAVKKLTQNVIDSYTQPFSGLVEFSKREPETVRNMFRNLFGTAEADVNEKQIAIKAFLNTSHLLRDKYFPDSFLFNDDLHSVTAYLFLYDPEHNYLYKASHCRSFADCVEFYDDWGYGADTKLDIFYRMCDEVLEQLKKNEPLLETNEGRYKIDPDGMHPDTEKHILLFDLIYCCTTYGLFRGITFDTPKTGERKLLQERKEKAQNLAAALGEAKKRFDFLNEAKTWLSMAMKPGEKIHHKSFGEGTVLEVTEKTIIGMFPSEGQKKLGKITCLVNGIVWFDDEEKQEGLVKRKDVLRKEEQIRIAVNWAEKALMPYSEYLN